MKCWFSEGGWWIEALAFVNDSIEIKLCEIAQSQQRKIEKMHMVVKQWVKFIRNKKKNTNKDLCNKKQNQSIKFYLHYRENIDDLIIQAVEKCLELVRKTKRTRAMGW